ncbi:MAG TPA: hypothetical protein VGR35_19315 [Tepidisphaeraceae bacterium]|nr:hypothetical protein [Tepidisphaeraceae bacterium]
MRYLLALSAVLVLAALGPGFAADPEAPVPPDRAAADVSLIAAWVAGSDQAKSFEKPFGDSGYITKADAAILYTDVEGVTVPAKLKRVPYDFIKPRMEMIRGAHKVDPAVLITRSVAKDPKEGMFGQVARDIRKAMPGERYYYVEVAIGNMAWHWMKVRLYEVDGKLKVEFVRSAIS